MFCYCPCRAILKGINYFHPSQIKEFWDQSFGDFSGCITFLFNMEHLTLHNNFSLYCCRWWPTGVLLLREELYVELCVITNSSFPSSLFLCPTLIFLSLFSWPPPLGLSSSCSPHTPTPPCVFLRRAGECWEVSPSGI